MSNVINIEELKKEFEDKVKVKDLKSFAQKQQEVIENLMQENTLMREKLVHLELMLGHLSTKKHKVTPEELICIEQIDVLKNRSSQRELNLEEVKRLDLLVKNLRLLRNESTEVIDATGYGVVQEEDLVAIATTIKPDQS